MEKKEEISEIESELKVSVIAVLEREKEGYIIILCHRHDGWGKRVPVRRSRGINELANTFVRLIFNLIAKGC